MSQGQVKLILTENTISIMEKLPESNVPLFGRLTGKRLGCPCPTLPSNCYASLYAETNRAKVFFLNPRVISTFFAPCSLTGFEPGE